VAKRLDYIDVLKGIGIVYVILGHFLHELPPYFRAYIYTFHMPLFFFISGYLFNYDKNKQCKPFIQKRVKSLLIPYLILEGILFIYNFCYNIAFDVHINYSEYIESIFYGNKIFDKHYISTLWFLLCLFVTEILFYLVFYVSKRNKVITSFAIILSSIIGFIYSDLTSFRLPFAMDVAFTALAFYSLGYFFRHSHFSSKLLTNKALLLPLFFMANLGFGFLNYNQSGRTDLLFLSYGNYLYFYAAAISGILFYFLLSQFININLLKYFGRNSLIIMSFHLQILAVLKRVLFDVYQITIPESVLIPVLFLLVVVINSFFIFLINRYAPFLIGRYRKKQPQLQVNLSSAS
jgi:acyltransferase